MNRKPNRTYAVMILVILAALSTPSELQAQGSDGWIQIRNSAQGYGISVPESAIVKRYDPEGIVHITLVDKQTLTIRTVLNLKGLSAVEWTDDWLSTNRSFLDKQVGPDLPIIRRYSQSVQGMYAEAVDAVGAKSPYRTTILATDSHIYLLGYPIGGSGNESVFERMVGSFEVGSFAADGGIQVVRADPLEAISSLQVPYYSQKDPQWVCDQYGTCNCNFNTCTTQTYTGIGDAGCFITSLAMIFEYYSVAHFKNPQEVDSCFTDQGAYGSWAGCAYGLCGAPYSPPSACKPASVTYIGQSDPPDFGLLDSELTSGYPVIALIDDGGHYVVVKGKSGGNYLINDPYYDRSQITPGEIEEFMRYHGPVPPSGCCGCSKLNATSRRSSSFAAESFRGLSSASYRPVSVSTATQLAETAPGPEPTAKAKPAVAFPLATIIKPTATPQPAATDESPYPSFIPIHHKPVEAQRTPPSSENYRIPKSVFGSGGGEKTSASFVMNSTQGQGTDLHRRQSASYVLAPGYWGQWTPLVFDHTIYLPLVVRNH